jgi:mercuric ion transport protein
MNKKKNIFWVTLAFLTCPCHSVIIFMALAGSAGITYFTENIFLFLVVLSLIFFFSLFMVFKNNKKKNETRPKEHLIRDEELHIQR